MSTFASTPFHASWPQQHAGLRRLLRTQRQALRQQRRSLRETLPWEDIAVADEEERAAQELALGLDVALLEMSSLQVQEIETAVHLMEAGAYGRCIDCRESIVASRLLARPFAVRCRACQEAVEGRARGAFPAFAPSTLQWEERRDATPRLRRGLRGRRGEWPVAESGSPARQRRPSGRRP